MQFLPRKQVLTLEELAQIGRVFAGLGVKKIRLTGGEPLVRKNIIQLFNELGAIDSLEELTLTTNGSQLVTMAEPLRQAGVKRINISLDSLNAERFHNITRTGDLDTVLKGIQAAKAAGFERIKLNAVILKGRNDDEILPLVDYVVENGLDISFIEEMPLGHIDEHDRQEAYMSSDQVREIIEQKYSISNSKATSAGPSKYFSIDGTSSRLGFISPHSHNFCGDCNRVRVTVEGRLLLCLGNEHSVDLKQIIREYPGDDDRLAQTIIDAMDLKPEKHHFDLSDTQIVRFMSMTGG